ncbi:MAG: mevalonate kinase [Euryarchaeota archaeon]|nr:mevalonate kinase [Euryarchaeota archaeon]
MGFGKGYGKVILFNEHFVVHSVPAIASAIGLTTDTEVIKHDKKGINLIDNRKGTKGYSEEKQEHQMEALKRVTEYMGFDVEKNPIQITLGGNLPTFSGIGASAANLVSIVRGVNDEFSLGFSDEEVNNAAYEGERAFAGTPSGIDNTAATFGGLIWFKKGEENVIERLSIKKPVEIVMGNTGVVANTKEVVAGVRKRKEKYPEKYDKVFKDAEKLVYKAREALMKYDLERVGKLMNENHRQLQAIEVDGKELNFLVDLARDNGALGAKLTGGGVGGCMVALTPGKELQENVASAMEKKGFQVLRTKIR